MRETLYLKRIHVRSWVAYHFYAGLLAGLVAVFVWPTDRSGILTLTLLLAPVYAPLVALVNVLLFNLCLTLAGGLGVDVDRPPFDGGGGGLSTMVSGPDKMKRPRTTFIGPDKAIGPDETDADLLDENTGGDEPQP